MQQQSGQARPLRAGEADEILDAALKLEAQSDDPRGLSLVELKRIGAEIGLSAEHIDEAAALLAERQRARAERGAQRRRVLSIAALVLGISGAAAGVGVLSGRDDLLNHLAQTEQTGAQLANVRLRQQQVTARLRDAPPDAERTAELSGSENRVAIEARRYDQTVSEYNRTAQTLTGHAAAALFGLPGRLQFSAEPPARTGGGSR